MKKILAFLTVISMVLTFLASCLPAVEDCDHDYNGAGVCVLCGEECEHERLTDRGYCPDCKQSDLPQPSCGKHADKNDDGKCDNCKNLYEDGCDVHRDADDDGACDTQGCYTVCDDGCEGHVDVDDDCYCDRSICHEPFSDGCDSVDCLDTDGDGKCNNAGCEKETSNTPCEHKDADDDEICDNCDRYFSDGCDVHRDADDDGRCDKCNFAFSDGCDNHRDADDDGYCDVFGCGTDFTDGCDNHRDADDDGRCDAFDCGVLYSDDHDVHFDKDDNGICDFNGCSRGCNDGCDNHRDADDDGVCDAFDCDEPYEDGCDNHFDDDGDELCDECGGALDSCNHIDRDDNERCDKCGTPFTDACDFHIDLNDNNLCDKCEASWWDGCDNHVDANDDGFCDNTYYCTEPYEDGHDVHIDLDDNNFCDICNTSWWDGCDNHVDKNDDGYCDLTYYCTEEFWDGCEAHRDADDNGFCDNTYYCSEPYDDGCDIHRDADDDAKCDKCEADFRDECEPHRDANDDGKCDKCGMDFSDGKEGEVEVSIRKSGSGITLTQTNVTAMVNEPLVISVTFSENYRFDKSVPEGIYDAKAGTLTIPQFPSATTRVTVYSRAAEEFYFSFEGSENDTCSIRSGDFYLEDTLVTVKAGDMERQFAGWSYGKPAANGGKIFSTEREAVFALTSALSASATNSKIAIYANYIDGNVYFYDVNGGKINTNSTNRTHTGYYTAVATSGKLKVTLASNYYNVVGAVASTFYDDGTFYREGYILKEYNTKADGTGEGYSLGAKFSIEPINGANPTLYCIWEKETAATDFNYKNVTISRPASEKSLPYWSEEGIEITAYLGDDTTVVIPEKIDGKYVTSIAAGAFSGKKIEELVMGRRILRIADGAFTNCTSLSTVYFPDGVTYVTDNFMDSATRASFANLRMNAVMPPKYSANAWAGLFAIKLTRLMSTKDTNRLIMIGGSSIYEGVASAYLEALLNEDLANKDYSFINFGTTRTLTIMLYFDAVDHYTKEGDMVIMSPENHARAMGDMSFVANSYDDSEGMYPSLMRYLDIRNFTDVFTSLGQFNLNRAGRNPTRYEEICKLGGSDAYGDDISDNTRRSLYRNEAGAIAYTDTYIVTFNDRIKSAKDASWNDAAAQEASRDWKDPNNETWCSFNDPLYANQVNRMIDEIKATGSSVYFAFAPVDGTGVEGSTWGVIPECKADPVNWLAAYDKLITDTYHVDGLIGKSSDYIYHHNYFYDNIYHLNNWGRAIRTYQLYLDLCDTLGITNKVGATSKGTDFAGCLFESDLTNPQYKVDWLK